jgi:hypothetical protein
VLRDSRTAQGSASDPVFLTSPVAPSPNITPGGTIVIDTPQRDLSASRLDARMPPPSMRLFSTPSPMVVPTAAQREVPSTIFSPTRSSSSSTARTRSIAHEISGISQELHVHDPNPSHDISSREVLVTLPCGTHIYKDRPPAPMQTLHYPTLATFDRDAWEYFIVKYRRENLIAHKQNSIPIIRRIDHGIIHEVCTTFGIDVTIYHSVTNRTMEQHMFTRFGPETPSVARDRFHDKPFKFNDTSQHQNTFASKLSRYLQEKCELIQDFTHAEDTKWHPLDDFTHLARWP